MGLSAEQQGGKILPRRDLEAKQFLFRVGSVVTAGDKPRGKRDQDRAWVSKEGSGVVCDGLGGSSDGARAAQIVMESIRDSLRTRPEHTSLEQAQDFVRNTIVAANDAIDAAKQATSNRLTADAATTVCAVYMWNGHAIVGNFGDSRASLLRERELTDISLDHSVFYDDFFGNEDLVRPMQDFLSDLVDPTTLKGKFFEYWDKRYLMSRSVKGYSHDTSANPVEEQRARFRDEIDIYSRPIRSGDRWIIYSDGLTYELTRNERRDVSIDQRFIGDPLLAAKALNDTARERHAVSKRAKKGLDDRATVVIDVL